MLRQKFSSLVTKLEMSMHTHTSTTTPHTHTDTHTQTHTAAHIDAPTSVHTTNAPTPLHTTNAPTPLHTTNAPTPLHTTNAPTTIHTTYAPTTVHTTNAPTTVHTTNAPTPLHTTNAPTTVHTNAPTPVHTTNAPTPTCTQSSTLTHTAVPTAEQLHLLVQQLSHENSSLKRDVAELTRRCNDLESEVNNVKLQLAQFTSAPRLLDHHTTLRRGWHEQANDIIGASHSRASPTNEYKCAHAGCNWRNKKVTLQAYVLHLKRKHGENISDNPDLSLLPVLSR